MITISVNSLKFKCVILLQLYIMSSCFIRGGGGGGGGGRENWFIYVAITGDV